MDRETKAFNLELKSLDEAGMFEGLLSVYNVVDAHNDVVEHGAYVKTLQESGGSVPLLWQHDPTRPIGTLLMKDGPEGLYVSGRLALHDDVPDAKMAYALLKRGVVRGLSIGYKAIKKVTGDNGIRRLKEIKLFEGSLVTIPANRFAVVTDVKAATLQRKDFAEELERIQTGGLHYQMLNALSSALEKIRYEDEGSREQRIAMGVSVVQQFAEAYTDYLPRLMDLMGVKLDAPQLSAQMIANTDQQILDLKASHSGTESAAGAEEAKADNAMEPQPHSIALSPEWLANFNRRFFA